MGIQQRIDRLRQRMTEEKLDAFFTGSPENRNYLSGFTGSAGYLFITAKDASLATDFRYVEQAGQQSPLYSVVRISGKLDWFTQLVSDSGARRIGFEADNMTVSQHQSLKDALKSLESKPKLVSTNALVDQIRAVKDPEELTVMEEAIRIADKAMDSVTERMRPGMTELDVAWQMELAMRELGADAISFDTIVAAGPNGAKPHHHPTDRRIEKGEPVVIDMGAKYNWYCSDITRTVVLGKADDTFRKVYDTVLAAQETAEATVRAAMTGGDTDELARTVIAQAGHGEHFGHSLGHGIGLAVHEYPRVGPSAAGLLTDGMVFTIEPGIYLTGWGGVRIEDIVVLENGLARIITAAHKRDVVQV
ncbi:MAG: aminopeptidase P family protein [Chloroflexi bacterium]|nr:aminopeptidase P family protein [Chloroflexota bacterium]